MQTFQASGTRQAPDPGGQAGGAPGTAAWADPWMPHLSGPFSNAQALENRSPVFVPG